MSARHLTVSEIEARYPNQWVLLADPTLAKGHIVTGGGAVVSCADRAEFLRRAGEWDDPAVRQTASWHTGPGAEADELLLPDATSGAA